MNQNCIRNLVFLGIVLNYLKESSFKRIMCILARKLEHLSDTNCSIRLSPTVNKTLSAFVEEKLVYFCVLKPRSSNAGIFDFG